MTFWADMVANQIEEENYQMASVIAENFILRSVDGCVDGNELFDLIKDCDEQAKIYHPAKLLVRTLNQLSGKIKPPTVSASADVTSGGNPLEVHFTGTATNAEGTIVRYWWDFGDGKSSSEQNPTHIYECPGDYEVTFGAVDNKGIGAHQGGLTINVDYPKGTTSSFACDLLPMYKAMVCTQCHNKNPDSKAGLDLGSYEGIMKGSINGPVVIPGDPENSVIVKVTGPPRNHAADVGAKPVDPQTLAKQRAWILEGALNN
jgi:PKD repeat protein